MPDLDPARPREAGPDAPTTEPDAVAHCPWCAAPAAEAATRCAACGASIAQRESIGDLVIPGLTSVDPALEDFDRRPLHLRGPSPSQGMAPALIVGAIAGGPAGLAAIGGVAAVAAVEYLGAGRGTGAAALESVGRPSEVVLQALDRLAERAPASAPTASRTMAAGGAVGAVTPTGDAMEDRAAADGGRSIWRDLPPVESSRHATDEEATDGHR